MAYERVIQPILDGREDVPEGLTAASVEELMRVWHGGTLDHLPVIEFEEGVDSAVQVWPMFTSGEREFYGGEER